MKKRITRTFAAMLILATVTLHSCAFIEYCGTCEKVVDDGTNITYPEETIVCGDAYYALADAEPVTENGVTTYWNCY